jgi:methyl-accepting chemotaxis protein
MNVDEARLSQILRRIMREELSGETARNSMREVVREEIASDSTRQVMRQVMGDEIDARLEIKLANAFGQFTNYFDVKLKQSLDPLQQQFNKMQNTLDGYIGRLANDEEERAGMSNQLNRHQKWIDELAGNTRTKLSPL